MNNIQCYTNDADIKIRPGVTSVSKAVVERIKAASWDEINTVDDMGFQIIARAVKDRQARNDGVLMEELCDLMYGEPEEEQEENDGYQDGED